MFNNTLLIEISGLKERTFYRYLQELRNQHLLQKTKKYYYDIDEANKIAELMGFKIKMEAYIETSIKKVNGKGK